MHEVSIVEGLLEHIALQKEKNSFNKVLSVEIVAGKYNCVSQDNLRFCFRAATENNPDFINTKITVTRLPQKYLCGSCKKEFESDSSPEAEARCTGCGSSGTTPLISSELYLSLLEVE